MSYSQDRHLWLVCEKANRSHIIAKRCMTFMHVKTTDIYSEFLLSWILNQQSNQFMDCHWSFIDAKSMVGHGELICCQLKHVLHSHISLTSVMFWFHALRTDRVIRAVNGCLIPQRGKYVIRLFYRRETLPGCLTFLVILFELRKD